MYSPLPDILQQFWINTKIWLATTLLFCTGEMKEEVRNHEFGAPCRIPEAWTSFNILTVLRVIEARYPGRTDIKLDYILSLGKALLLLVMVISLIVYQSIHRLGG